MDIKLERSLTTRIQTHQSQEGAWTQGNGGPVKGDQLASGLMGCALDTSPCRAGGKQGQDGGLWLQCSWRLGPE